MIITIIHHYFYISTSSCSARPPSLSSAESTSSLCLLSPIRLLSGPSLDKKKLLLSLFTTVFPCLNYIYLEGQRICEADTFAHPKASEFAFCSTSEARTRLVANEERTGRTSNGFSSATLVAKTYIEHVLDF